MQEDIIIQISNRLRDIRKEKNITLIRIKENNRNYVKDIKTQIIENIDIIKSITNLYISKSEIELLEINNHKVFSTIINMDNITNIISNYSSAKEFREKNPYLYLKLLRLKSFFKKGIVLFFTRMILSNPSSLLILVIVK